MDRAGKPRVQDGQAAAEAMRRRKFREGLRADAFSSPGGFDTAQKSLL
jgi:hypothetical protein